MSKKLTHVIRQLKTKFRQTPQKCREVLLKYNQERGIIVCQSIHIIYVIVTTVGALPYKVQKLDNGYRRFSPVKGLRKWFVNGMYTYMVLRTLSYALLPLSGKLRFSVGGNFTADCLIWVLSVQIAAVPAISCYKFGRNPKDVELIYNALAQVMITATRKYFNGKHIFELVQIHWLVVLIFTSASVTIGLGPILSLGVFIPLKDSPAFLSYHIAGPYSEIQGDDICRLVLWWIGAIVHWMYLNYLVWTMVTLMVLMGEGIIGCTILLKNIRSLDPKEIHWRAKLKLHAQLEIILDMYNAWVGLAAPVTILAGLMFSVCSIITLMKVDLEMDFPKPSLIPIFIMFAAGGSFGGAIIMKYAEELRANSIDYLKEVEATITEYVMLEVRRGRRLTYCPSGRTFRRRPIGVRMGMFMFLDEGLSTSYLMQIQDNTINYFFMVDLRSHPVWLWKTF